jgi:hypothetical protein
MKVTISWPYFILYSFSIFLDKRVVESFSTSQNRMKILVVGGTGSVQWNITNFFQFKITCSVASIIHKLYFIILISFFRLISTDLTMS